MSLILKDYFGNSEVEVLHDPSVQNKTVINGETVNTIQELVKKSPDKIYSLKLNVRVLSYTTLESGFNYMIHENTGFYLALKCKSECKLQVNELYALEIVGEYNVYPPKTPTSPWTHHIKAESVKIGIYPSEIPNPGKIVISPVKISKIIESKAFGFSIDTIGYVSMLGDEKRVKRKNGDEANKRDVVLYDETGQIYMTIWGNLDINVTSSTIIAIRAAKISDYNGVTLNLTLKSDSILISPIHYRTPELKEWSQNKENSKIVNQKPHFFKNFKQKSPYFHCITISEIVDSLIKDKLKEKQLGIDKINEITNDPEPKKPKYFNFYGYVYHISMDQKFYYSACPRCKKKLNKQMNKEGSVGGTSLSMEHNKNLSTAYFCYNCQKFYTKANQTYSIHCLMSDGTDIIPVYFFSEKAQEMLNIPVETIATLKDKEDFDSIDSELQKSVYFKQFKFKILAKPNTQILHDLEAVKERNRKLKGVGSYREKIKDAFIFQAFGIEKIDWNEYMKCKISVINSKITETVRK